MLLSTESNCRDRGGSSVDTKTPVRVLEVLPDGVRRDPQEPRDLAVRSALGHELENLRLAITKPVREPRPRSGATARGPCAKPLEVREHDVQDVPIAFSKAPVRPIKLESGSACGSARVDPEPDHVLDPQGAADVVVELEAVELSWRQVVRVHLHAARRLQRRLTPPKLVRLAYCWSDDSARFPHRVDSEVLVVGNNVTGNEPSKRIQNRLRERVRSVDVGRLAQHVEYPLVVRRR